MDNLGRVYIQVILPLKLDWEPYYYIDRQTDNDDYSGSINHLPEIEKGLRVNVSFNGKNYVAVIKNVSNQAPTAKFKINPINHIESNLSIISKEELLFWDFISKYYLCSIGEVYKEAYPVSRLKTEKSIVNNLVKSLGKSKKIATDETKRQIEKEENTARELNEIVAVKLSHSQQEAKKHIERSFPEYKPVLLQGVTASGKTHVYASLAMDILEQGKNILFLVPEIAINQQIEERIKKIFGHSYNVLGYNSESKAKDKKSIISLLSYENNKTEKIPSPYPYIIIGTRSSLFLPYKNLGLIIVDEEQDSSYKQQSPSPRYNAREAAIMLAKIHKAKIILGSATPSLESIHNSLLGKYVKVELTSKYFGNEEQTEIEVIDISNEIRKNGMLGSISRKLFKHMQDCLNQKKQILILCPRKSYSPALQCDTCGHIPKCPNCNVSLSLYKNFSQEKDINLCHYCGHKEIHKKECPICKQGSLLPIGKGTQKIEEEIIKLFPNHKIERLDGETVQKANHRKNIISNFSKGEIDILIGTQMITKGLDFNNLSLVAVVGTDSLLSIQDFRADEKAFQLLEQFKGRTGRREEKGLFVIQTMQSSHPLFARLKHSQDEKQRSNKLGKDEGELSLLEERRNFAYPPYTRAINIIIKDINEKRLELMASKLALTLQNLKVNGAEIVGPYPPAIDKISKEYIRHIRLMLKKDKYLLDNKTQIHALIKQFEKTNKYSKNIQLDVDPM